MLSDDEIIFNLFTPYAVILFLLFLFRTNFRSFCPKNDGIANQNGYNFAIWFLPGLGMNVIKYETRKSCGNCWLVGSI